MDLSYRLENINEVAKKFWEAVGNKTVFAFHGELGAGKTSFIHALCDEKEVEGVVGSPSFSIINEYIYTCEGTRRLIFHLDLYRIKNEEEAARAGMEDVLYSGHTCLVEWPEKAPALFPPGTVHVWLTLVDQQTRQLKITNI